MQNKSLIYNRMTRHSGSNSKTSKVERIFGNDQIKVKAIQKDEVGKEVILSSLLRRIKQPEQSKVCHFPRKQTE
jgi:hypothetical protein